MAADNGRGPTEATKVRRTGLAVVHEGEWVVAAVGSEAEFDSSGAADQTVINYYFPVEIEVVSTSRPIDHDQLVDVTLGRLAEYLEGLA
jgi:hypothetical protein